MPSSGKDSLLKPVSCSWHRRGCGSVLLLLLPLWAVTSPGVSGPFTINDADGGLAETEAPVTNVAQLRKSQAAAARAGRLGLTERSGKSVSKAVVPVQWELSDAGSELRGVWLMPSGTPGARQFELRESKTAFALAMQAKRDLATGQIDVTDGGEPVLRYNYNLVEPGALLDRVTPANRIYARARSDYIHPLYGPEGEVLTQDWAVDHPHHRGIYWAWPEVDYGTNRGDLHALQKVFARPTGKVRLQGGPVFAEVEAENLWLWEDSESIVREVAIIRAYRATAQGRVLDLAFRFVALKDGVTLARRGMAHYGGLNIRMATPASQDIFVHTDESNAVPRRAWSDLSGVFAGADAASGLTVLQSRQNPDYPGEWVQYPNLSWCQPTFPATGTRYALRRHQPLVLRYRLLIHAGGRPGEDRASRLWEALQSPAAGVPVFGPLKSAD